MRKALLLLDTLLLAVTVGMVLFAPGQDPAGRGVLWFSIAFIAMAIAASLAADRVRAHKFALMCAALVPIAAIPIVYSMGSAMVAERQEFNGTAYWDDPGMLAMASAINAGDTATVRTARGAADLNAIGREGMTLLVFAIRRRPETVAPLLRLGANPNLVGPGTLPPLAQALDAPDSTFAALLTSGADPNGPGDNGSPVLFSAIRGRLFDRYTALVAAGADVKRLDALGRTSLMAAAESGEWTIALDLLARDVDIAHTASDGTTLRGILERQRPSRADEAAFRELIARVEERERLDRESASPRDSA